MKRIVVIGARRRRQGIGGYVACAFHAAGCNVRGVVGTSMQTAIQARDDLRCAGIDANPYDDLDEALTRARPHIVAVCTPYSVHREQLRRIAQAPVHCLCEKPLWWGASAAEAEQTHALIEPFARAGRYVDLLTQWPRTLPAYRSLFPREQPEPIERFDMRLSPIARGAEMVLDAAPHVLSMLWALVGPGQIEAPQARFRAAGQEVKLDFAYRHGAGDTRVACELVTCPEQPRPAWYGINGRIAERQIEMPGYRMRLRARDEPRQVPLPDPLPLQVQAFLEDVRRGATMDVDRLVASVTQLAALYRAAEQAL